MVKKVTMVTGSTGSGGGWSITAQVDVEKAPEATPEAAKVATAAKEATTAKEVTVAIATKEATAAAAKVALDATLDPKVAPKKATTATRTSGFDGGGSDIGGPQEGSQCHVGPKDGA
jgi:hypothetical protein